MAMKGADFMVNSHLKGDVIHFLVLVHRSMTEIMIFPNYRFDFQAKGKGEFMVSFGMDYTDTCCGGKTGASSKHQ
jgi:hypothetical protein